MNRGVDMMNTLLQMEDGFAQKLDNAEYTPDTLRRRAPFVNLHLGNGSDLNTDYTAMGPFVGQHEYVDSAGGARLLHAHSNGTIQELDRTAGGDTARVSGLNGASVRFESFMGACIACNGVDAPQRADDGTWRTFGAPAAVAGLAVTGAAGALTGAYQWIIVPIIQVSGITAVRGDWSNIAIATLGAQLGRLTWTPSADLRVTGYEIYRSFAGLGYPYSLAATVAGRTTATYDDNLSDASLSGQVADESGQDGPAPIAKYVSSAGKRVAFGFVIDATDPDASKTAWISRVATNKYECEYFPNDKVNRIRLPGKGDLTCIAGVGQTEGQESGTDLFMSQLTSCYLLPDGNPLNALQTISQEVGVINNEAFAKWGKWAFFVSLRGLEFLGPTGAPLLISKNVQAFFFGGGELGFNGNQGSQYITCCVADQKLIVTTRQDSGRIYGDTALILDLTTFNPYAIDIMETARFTVWFGPGMAAFLFLRDRSLLCFDNQNARILEASAGAYDQLAGVNTPIECNIWSGAILGDSPEYRKTPAMMNLLMLCDSAVGVRLDGDYSAESSGSDFTTVNPTFVPRSWDKVWDKAWYGDTSYGGSVSMPRTLNSYLFQLKLQCKNGSQTFTYIGMVLHYRQSIARVYGKR